jgi:hypothetical protein
LCLRDQFLAIVAETARRNRSRQVDCYCHRRVFEELVRALPGYSTPTMGARRYKYRHTVRRHMGLTYDPCPSRQCEPVANTWCWIGC